MLKTLVLKQKQAGIILITLGGFLFAFIFLFLYFNVIRVPGFPEFLPVKETIGFVEFPAALDENLARKISETLGVDWNRDIAPWASEKAALALLKNYGAEPEQISPFFFIQTRSATQAFSFLKNFKNPQKEIREVKFSGVTAFLTPQLSFAFLSDVLVIAPTAKSLAELLAYQSSSTQHLSSDSDFIQIHANVSGPFFAYFKPKEMPAQIFSAISSNIPYMPISTKSFPAIGIAAEKMDAVWRGMSYALLEKNLPPETPQAYRAKFLTVLPSKIDFMLSGQNLFGQIKKIDEILGAHASFPKLSMMIQRLINEYLPDVDAEKNLTPLFEKEFAFAMDSDRFLLLAEEPDQNAQEKIESLRKTFQKTNGRLTPKTRDVLLPDGTKAKEFVADPSKVKTFEEMFGGVTVRGFLLGKNGAVYDAFSNGTWFISNDFEMIKKALQSAKEPNNSFRESPLYKETLQPILKNPELLGLAVLPHGTFGFSKRTMPDHMETNFMWIQKN
ncbi:DUF3352 domain-containing protein [Candidatus Peregrinibacteria bacterium]|nr:DUF3352 domain-containing protein [Candidatus Peregrinibacteria bacterium]